MPEPIAVTFIGTGGVSSFSQKKLPSIAIKMKNELIVLDAGEGCQYSLFRKKFHPVKSALNILLTHLHTDHVSGLPGIIHTLTLARKKGIVHIIGPKGTKEFTRGIIELFNITPIPLILDIKEALNLNKPSLITSTELFDIIAFRTEHDVSSLGYILIEKKKPIFDVEKANKLNIPPNLRKKLVAGHSIKLPNGKIIKPNDILKIPLFSRKIVYTGDTRPIRDPDIIEAMKNADLLIHESTFIRKYHKELAETRFHSTVEDAIETALLAKVKKLALIHISPRYKELNAIHEIVRETLERLGIENEFEVVIPNDDETLIL